MVEELQVTVTNDIETLEELARFFKVSDIDQSSILFRPYGSSYEGAEAHIECRSNCGKCYHYVIIGDLINEIVEKFFEAELLYDF